MNRIQLGIAARSTYVETEHNMNMPHREGDGGGGAAAESVQSTLDSFGEPTVAGKTHSEILSMTRIQRWRWSNKIDTQEKSEVLRIVKQEMLRKREVFWDDPENHRKASERMKEVLESANIRRKISEKAKGRKHSIEVKKRIAEGNKGKIISEKQRKQISKTQRELWETPEYRDMMLEKLSSEKRKEKLSKLLSKRWENPEFKEHISQKSKKFMMNRYVGEDNPNWRGGSSFEPYCEKFNNRLRNKVRNRHDRSCVMCGKSEILNGRKLSVHHVDADKMQGCNGKSWFLVPLCVKCHTQITASRGQKAIESEFILAIKAEEYRRVES